MKIQLIARISYADSITEGKPYFPISQTKTGFLIKGNDDYEIDLYGHFFRIGVFNEKTGEVELLPEKAVTVKESVSVEPAVKQEEKTIPPVKEVSEKQPDEKKIVKKQEKESIVEPKNESSIDHLINDDDDF